MRNKTCSSRENLSGFVWEAASVTRKEGYAPSYEDYILTTIDLNQYYTDLGHTDLDHPSEDCQIMEIRDIFFPNPQIGYIHVDLDRIHFLTIIYQGASREGTTIVHLGSTSNTETVLVYVIEQLEKVKQLTTLSEKDLELVNLLIKILNANEIVVNSLEGMRRIFRQ